MCFAELPDEIDKRRAEEAKICAEEELRHKAKPDRIQRFQSKPFKGQWKELRLKQT